MTSVSPSPDQEASGTTGGLTPMAVMDKRGLRDFHVLSILAQAGDPVGCGTLANRLASLGLSVGEATAGRWLRDQEVRGLVRSVGRGGRVLTARGHEYLEQLKLQRAQWDSARELSSVLLTLSGDQLVDILVARRALETKAAALAATHARKKDLAAIEAVVHRRLEARDDVLVEGEQDYAFHYAVADASRNLVIAKAVRMIRSAEPRFPVLAYIRRSMGHQVLADHVAIYEAIARRDPEAARAAMAQHIDQVVADVRAYWQRNRQRRASGDARSGGARGLKTQG